MSLLDWFSRMRPRQTDAEMKRELVASGFSTITDSIIDTHSAIKVLAITVTAELVGFAMFYVSKHKVQDFLAENDNSVWMYGSIALFLIGFLTTFGACRLISDQLKKNIPASAVWLLSLTAGIANIGLFFLLVSFQLR